jgi:hypothetical protein
VKASKLTDAEIALTRKLGDCMNEYASLPLSEVGAEDDLREFAQAIHVCQRAVMCRLAHRVHPQVFPRGRI